MGEVTAKRADQVAERPAVGMRRPVVGAAAERRLQRRRRRQPRRAQLQFLHSRWFLDAQAINPQVPGERGPELLDLPHRQPLALPAPAPKLAPGARIRQLRRRRR
jgi:hypothetical protein